MAEETSLTVIDPLEPPPMGDCDLAELKRRYGDRIVLNDLFAYRRQGTDRTGREVGKWTCGGKRPLFADKCEKRGVALLPETYAPTEQ
mgnify:CR=1 FL=1